MKNKIHFMDSHVRSGWTLCGKQPNYSMEMGALFRKFTPQVTKNFTDVNCKLCQIRFTNYWMQRIYDLNKWGIDRILKGYGYGTKKVSK